MPIFDLAEQRKLMPRWEDWPKEAQLEAQSSPEKFKNGCANFNEKGIPLGLEIGTLVESLLKKKKFKLTIPFLRQVTGICSSLTPCKSGCTLSKEIKAKIF